MVTKNDRYLRQTQVSGMSLEKQILIRKSKILVVGAGGLGCPVIQYLAGAGVGSIEILDDDIVELSNLHRQTLYVEKEIGLRKCDAAAARARCINSDVIITPRFIRFERSKFEIIETPDVVIDGTDNFESKYAISQFCQEREIPWVFGSVYQHLGQVAVFNGANLEKKRTGQLTDLYPFAPPSAFSPDCSAGVLGITVGVVGCLQAMEAFKLLTGVGEISADRVLIYDSSKQTIETLHYAKCLSATPQSIDQTGPYKVGEVSWKSALEREATTALIDIRGANEIAVQGELEGAIRIPISDLSQRLEELENYRVAYVFCSSGSRSKVGAKFLNKHWGDACSVIGGYAALKVECSED